MLFELDRFPGPPPAPAALPTAHDQHFEATRLARHRREATALTLTADAGGHFFDTARDQWGGARRSEDWFCLHHGEAVIQSLQLAVAGMGRLQPQELRRTAEGYRLSGRSEGWTHTLHFRPGRPRIHVPRDLGHRIDVETHAEAIRLKIRCHRPHAVAACLLLWVRCPSSLEQGRRKPVDLQPGQCLDLSAEAATLARGPHGIRLEGLPAPAHRLRLESLPAIPTATPDHCARLCLGVRLPVDLDITLRLVTLRDESPPRASVASGRGLVSTRLPSPRAARS